MAGHQRHRTIVHTLNPAFTRIRLRGSPIDDGWFDTGDIAVLDSSGWVRLVDRAKDVIKSGGEWISSIDLENAAMTHPDVRRAEVIGIADEKWGERPLLFIESVGTTAPQPDELIAHLRPLVPKWWLPAKFAYGVTSLGATGKIDKLMLRAFASSSDRPGHRFRGQLTPPRRQSDMPMG